MRDYLVTYVVNNVRAEENVRANSEMNAKKIIESRGSKVTILKVRKQ